MIRWILGGFAGAFVGVVAWVMIGYFGKMEYAWIAWGLGLLTGLGVRIAAAMERDDPHDGVQGLIAAGIALSAILLAKFMVFTLISRSIAPEIEEMNQVLAEVSYEDEAMIAATADEIIDEQIQAGRTVQWPEGMTYEEASVQEDYPRGIWREAERRWRTLGVEGQEQKREERRLMIEMLASLAKPPSFADSFRIWDILWIFLAVTTALKVGMGGTRDN